MSFINNKVIFQQIIYWVSIIIVVSGFKERYIRDIFKISYESNSIVDIFMLILFITMFLFINKIIVHENLNDFFNSGLILETKRYIKNFKITNYSYFNEKLKYEDILLPTNFSLFYLGLFYVFNLFYGVFLVSKEFNSYTSFETILTVFFFVWWLKHFMVSRYVHLKSDTMLLNKITLKVKLLSLVFSFLILLYNGLFEALIIIVSTNPPIETVSSLIFLSQLFMVSYVMLNPIFIFLIHFSINVVTIFKSEYRAASIKKTHEENKVIVTEFLKSKNKKEIIDEETNLYLLQHTKSLSHKKNFKLFLEFLEQKEYTESQFDELIKDFLLPVERMREARGTYIIKRNRDNLLIAIWTFGIFFCVFELIKILIYNYGFFGESLLVNFLDFLYILILIRLVMRATEICYAFYFDLQDGAVNKKSNLDRKSRASLALKSLLEIVLFSFLATFLLVSSNMMEEQTVFLKTILIDILRLLNVATYTFSVSLFNVSFENLKDVINSQYGFIRPIHLTQVISSVVLLTICLGSYINSKDLPSSIILEKVNNKLVFYEKSSSGMKRNILKKEFKSIEEVKQIIEEYYLNHKIEAEKYEIYVTVLKKYTFKSDT